ncbi:hypothetical protein MROS_0542 [Melioribacter roseus P3M-2]|uniref:Uncharacterized protein n=1 Tax=Melioribacter roseus (strain DSM 23840 / JCM 17771 / VKM B-2668 / P3M-2) TaxID=1191523 RepID=I6Z3R3_MELRP|nr:hypothetical protein [Melioribacter roseus]AFN73785.1 hypothetical protein MROS_0542 [Melioribacter roseus P3M-2]
MEKKYILKILAVGLIVLFFYGCAPSLSTLDMGAKVFSYDIAPQVKLEGIKTIAVLPTKTDDNQTLQAKLMEGLQKELNVNVIDIQQLTSIIHERKLKATNESISNFGYKTNVDLFLVAEDIGGQVAFKIIEKDGRIAFARFLKGYGEASYVDQIVKILGGYKKEISDYIRYTFPSDDKNKDEIISLLKNDKFNEAENKIKISIESYEPGFERALLYGNLANLYETQRRFGDALNALNMAEDNNQKTSIFKRIKPEAFSEARKKLQTLVEAESESKAASGGLTAYKKDAPNVAVMEFDTKAINDKADGWLASVFISTRLAQSNFNVYDRDYFLSLLQLESSLSEKEAGKLLGVDKLVYGKFLKKTQVLRNPIYRDEEYDEYDSKTKQRLTKTRRVLANVMVTYGIEIQGRVVDVKTGFGKYQTVSKEPVTVQYPGGNNAPSRDIDVEREWNVKLYDQLSEWIEKELSR